MFSVWHHNNSSLLGLLHWVKINWSDCGQVFLSVRSLEIIYPNSPHIEQPLISTIFFSCFSESSTASALVA